MDEIAELASYTSYDDFDSKEFYKALAELDLPSINYNLSLNSCHTEIPEDIINHRWDNTHIYSRCYVLKDIFSSITTKHVDEIIKVQDNVFDRVFASDFNFVDVKSAKINKSDIERLLNYLKNHPSKDVVKHLMYNDRIPKNLFSVEERLAFGELPCEAVKSLTFHLLDKIKLLDDIEINKTLAIYVDEIEDKDVKKEVIRYLATHKDPLYPILRACM